jgi:tRNA(Arg) A34 adenosine deaminase TadA
MNTKYLELAIELSQDSLHYGAFPAGAILVQNDEIISQSISAKYPKINFHAESQIIDEAINKLDKQLIDCELYASMEPCLMCISRAYWAGIRKIYFVIKKESVDSSYFESNLDHKEIYEKFNEKMEIIYVKEYEEQALAVVREWESKNKS